MTTPSQMPESLKVVAYRVDWPASDSIGRDRFFGADDTQRMNNHTSYCNGVAVAVPLVLKTDADALQAALNDRDAEIERLKKDAGCKWLPIAGAPKDGACVLVNDTSGLFTDYCMAKWLQGDEWSGWVYDDEATADNNPLGPQPTHFMLIPAIDSMKGGANADQA